MQRRTWRSVVRAHSRVGFFGVAEGSLYGCTLFFGRFFAFLSLPRMAFGKKHSLSSPRLHVFSCTPCVDLPHSLKRIRNPALCSWRVLQFPWERQRELSLPAVPVTTPAAQAAVRCIRMREYVDPYTGSWLTPWRTRVPSL